MGRKVRVGLIGAGFIGQVGHLQNFIQLDDCEVVAVADLRPELVRSVAARFNIPRAYCSHEELLQDRDIDAVVVVTHRSLTAEIVRDCLLAGKHVLSEKPMASTSEQANMLLEIARRNGLVYSVGFMKRHDLGVIAAREAIQTAISNQSLGRLTFVRIHCFAGDSYCKIDGAVSTTEPRISLAPTLPIAPEWLDAGLHTAYSIYLNTYSHDIDLIRFFTNETPEIEYSDTLNEDCQLAVLGFPGFKCILETGRSSNRGWDESAEFHFENGRISIQFPPPFLRNVPASFEIYEAGNRQTVTRPLIEWSWAFKRQASAFLDLVIAGRANCESATEAAINVEIAENLWKSSIARVDQSRSRRS